MEEKITLCGDNCLVCPRYLAKTEEELKHAADVWYQMGWRDTVANVEEMKCEGCSSHKQCTYHLVECIREHGIEKCNQCDEFPCEKINSMLERSKVYEEKCRKLCSTEDYDALRKAFFNKEENLKK